MEYLRDKALKAEGTEKETLHKQIEEIDGEIANIRYLSLGICKALVTGKPRLFSRLARQMI